MDNKVITCEGDAVVYAYMISKVFACDNSKVSTHHNAKIFDRRDKNG